nr:anticodon nuclease [uncultured Moraxella sp.]
MGKTINDIAKDLKNKDKKVQLIYAFNGTGKTRLSRAFKELISPKLDGLDSSELANKKILYYSSFTEDLFYWNNDLENDLEPKLIIQPNSFTRWVLSEQGQENSITHYFQHYTKSKLTPNFNESFDEVTFNIATGDNSSLNHIKISKGEESNFIWSIFYSLIEQVINVRNVPEPEERETNQFDRLEYIFIDDPVSSLDENHLIELAVNLAKLIALSKSSIKFIITTHNTLFYNVLFNEIKSKTGYILKRDEDGGYYLDEKQGDSNKSFSYHLFLKQTIEDAIREKTIGKYHFMLLRNLYEKTANFLGYQKWSDLLPNDENNVRQSYITRIMTFYSHSTLVNESIVEPTEPEKKTVEFLLNHLTTNYNFWTGTNESAI